MWLQFENPERELSSLAVLAQGLGTSPFASIKGGTRKSFDRVGHALAAANVEVDMDSAFKGSCNDIASASVALPSEIPLSIVSQVRRSHRKPSLP